MSDSSQFAVNSSTLIDLLNIALGSSLACGVGLAISLLCRRLSNPARHAILVSSLLLSLLCPLLAGLAQWSHMSLFQLEVDNSPRQRSDTLRDALPTIGDLSSKKMAFREGTDSPRSPTATSTDAVGATTHAAEVQGSPKSDVYPSTATSSSMLNLSHVVIIAMILWMAGILVKFVRMVRGLFFVRDFGRTCVPVSQSRLLRALRDAEQRLGRNGPIPIQSSPLAPAPLVMGLWRPRIVVPNGIEQELDDEQLVDVLAHEVAHLKRRDHWVGVVQSAATMVYWWNPLVGWASSLISDLREQICDDAATNSSRERRYAQALVKLADLVLQRSCIPASIGILPFKKNHLLRRISRLLDADRSRVTSLRRRAWVGVALVSCGLACLMAMTSLSLPTTRAATNDAMVTAPADAPDDQKTNASSADVDKSGPPFRLPPQLTGTVTAEDGTPIPMARVTFEFSASDKLSRTAPKQLRRVEVATNPAGQYQIDTRDFPVLAESEPESGFDITIYATAGEFAETWSAFWHPAKEASTVQLQPLKMPAGRVVRGRVHGPGNQAANPVILRALATFNPMKLWSPRPVLIEPDGSFEISVPKELDSELVFVSGKFAPVRVAVPANATRIDDVVLPPGTSLTGRVLNRDGEPIAACVVVATEESDARLHIYRAVKTNAQGEYRLPPLLGRFKLHLADTASTSDRIDDNELKSDSKPPPVAPIQITLNGESREQQFLIQAGPTLMVRGTIRWADGRPARNCEVSAWSGGVQLARLHSDANGAYAVQLPRPVDDIAISAIGLLDKQRAFHIAYPITTVEAQEKNAQFLVFKRLDQELVEADWELRPFKAATVAEPSAGSDELARLRRKYEEQSNVYAKASKAAKTPEAEQEIYKTQDPRNFVAPDVLALEAKYRGSSTAIEAMGWLVRMARSVGSADIPVSKARQEVVDILLEHYLEHPDLDLFLDQFESGADVERGETLLRRSLKSPHRKVRAAATYHLASYLWLHTHSKEEYQPIIDLLANDPQFAREIEYIASQIQKLTPVDLAKQRVETEQLVQQVRQDYADVSPPQQDYWTYGELAESLLFEMNYLAIGKIAPEIQGVDVQGQPVHLTKLRGKFVVVSFTHVQPYQFAHLKELAKKFSNDEVTIVNVMSYAKNEEVNQHVAAGEITWPVLAHEQYGPITRQWNIHGWPQIYVIDPRGVIRVKGIPSDWVVRVVGCLLEANKLGR